MTRKDYELIAAVLFNGRDIDPSLDEKPSYKRGYRDSLDHTAYSFAAMQSDNPRFDRARFLAACGIN